jgi:hypothetical protein
LKKKLKYQEEEDKDSPCLLFVIKKIKKIRKKGDKMNDYFKTITRTLTERTYNLGNHYRYLTWNMILRNISVYSKTNTYVYIDYIPDLFMLVENDEEISSSEKRSISFIENIYKSKKIEKFEPGMFKIKIQTEGFKPFYKLDPNRDIELDRKDFEGRFSMKSKIKIEIEEMAERLNMEIEIIDIYPIMNSHRIVDSIGLIVKEHKLKYVI